MVLSIMFDTDDDGVICEIYNYHGIQILDISDSANDCAIEYAITPGDMVRMRDYLDDAIKAHG